MLVERAGNGRPSIDHLARAMGGPSQEVISIGRLLMNSLGEFRALDLGSGSGRNSLCLASLGARVTAVDSSDVHLAALKQFSNEASLDIDVIEERAERFLPPDTYQLVLCHGILHFLPLPTALELIERLKASTVSGGIHIITVAQFDTLSEIPGSFAQQGYFLPIAPDQWLRAYADWRCVAAERYTKRDHHPGEGYHVHPIEKLIFQKPDSTSPVLCAETHLLNAAPRPDVRSVLMSDDLVSTPKQTFVCKIGPADHAFSYETQGPQLSFRAPGVANHKLELLFWSNHAAYFENDAMVGYSEYQTDVFHTFRIRSPTATYHPAVS